MGQQNIQADREMTNAPIGLLVTRDGGITGLTVVVRIYSGDNLSQFLDFDDGIFKDAGHTTPTLVLTEEDATNNAGFYAVDGGFDLSAITIPAAAQTLQVRYEITAGGESGSAIDTIEFYDRPVDLIWDEINRGADHNLKDSTGKQQRQASGGAGSEDVVAATATTITLAATESTIDDFLRFREIAIVDGTGAGQIRTIVSYVGATRVATLDRPWDTTPIAGDDYLLLLIGANTAANILSYYNDGRHTAIFIDAANGSAGTTLGVNGTVNNPVDTLADAVVLAAALNIRAYKLAFLTFVTLTSTHTDWLFYANAGGGGVNIGGQVVSFSAFLSTSASGIMSAASGPALFEDCALTVGLDNAIGIFTRCTVAGPFIMTATSSVNRFTDCVPFSDQFPLELDFTNGVLAVVEINRFAGPVTVLNRTLAGGLCHIGNVDGDVTFEASCTSPATAIVSGSARVVNNGTITVDDDRLVQALVPDRLLSLHTTPGTVGLGALLNAYDDGNGPSVFFNSGAAGSGTVLGEHGTPGNPVNDEADAFTIATALGIRKYTIAGGMTLAVEHDRWAFNGCEGSTLDPGGQDINNYCIRDMIVFGAMGAGTFSGRMWDSVTFGVTGFTGLFTRCGVGPGGMALKSGSANEFDHCYSFAARKATPAEIDFSAAVGNTRISFSACSGYWRITDSTFAGNTIALQMPSGYVEFEATCTAGLAEVSGTIEVVDDSGAGFTVDDSGLVPALVGDRALSEHSTLGTIGNAIRRINKQLGNDPAQAVTHTTAIVGTPGAIVTPDLEIDIEVDQTDPSTVVLTQQ